MIDFGAILHLGIARDYGYAERWDILKGLATAALFVACFGLRRQVPFLALAALFALPALDNLFRVHENVGGVIAELLGRRRGGTVAQLGEVVAFLGLGASVLVLFGASLRHTDAVTRGIALMGLGIGFMIGLFAVGVDLVHMLALRVVGIPTPASRVITLIEEGGELLSISLGLAFAVGVMAATVAARDRASLAAS